MKITIQDLIKNKENREIIDELINRFQKTGYVNRLELFELSEITEKLFNFSLDLVGGEDNFFMATTYSPKLEFTVILDYDVNENLLNSYGELITALNYILEDKEKLEAKLK